MDDQRDHRDNQQKVDEAGGDVKCQKAEKPQHQQNEEDQQQHGRFLSVCAFVNLKLIMLRVLAVQPAGRSVSSWSGGNPLMGIESFRPGSVQMRIV
jgi:hypothetical protein